MGEWLSKYWQLFAYAVALLVALVLRDSKVHAAIKGIQVELAEVYKALSKHMDEDRQLFGFMHEHSANRDLHIDPVRDAEARKEFNRRMDHLERKAELRDEKLDEILREIRAKR